MMPLKIYENCHLEATVDYLCPQTPNSGGFKKWGLEDLGSPQIWGAEATVDYLCPQTPNSGGFKKWGLEDLGSPQIWGAEGGDTQGYNVKSRCIYTEKVILQWIQ
ncbi:MAG: hypothetical protein SWJ54_24625 [Cyanobacteriota bacterium]|nr:hypothetical protein [Cyanobacteriota bacterium]